MSALTGDHNVLPTDPLGTDKSTVPVIDIKYAHATYQVVRRVIDLIQLGQRPTRRGRKQELSEVQLLLHRWDNLSLNKDGVLRRHRGTRTQIIVPKQLCSLVLKELHENMGHLGVDCTLDPQENAFIGLTSREISNTISVC